MCIHAVATFLFDAGCAWAVENNVMREKRIAVMSFIRGEGSYKYTWGLIRVRCLQERSLTLACGSVRDDRSINGRSVRDDNPIDTPSPEG